MPASSWARMRTTLSACGGKSAARSNPKICRRTLSFSLGPRPKSSTGPGLSGPPGRASPIRRSGSGIPSTNGWRPRSMAWSSRLAPCLKPSSCCPGRSTEEGAAEKHMAQLQHNMWVVASRSAVLSIITGGGKWVEITVHADPLYQHLLLTAEKKFWRCVQTGEPPAPVRGRAAASAPCGGQDRGHDLVQSAGPNLPRPTCNTRAAHPGPRSRQGRAEEAGAGGRQGGDRPRHPRRSGRNPAPSASMLLRMESADAPIQ